MKLIHILSATAGLAIIAGGAMAQGGPGGGGGMPPEFAAKIKAWQKFSETHKNFQTLQKIMLGFAECEKDPKTALTKDQAKAILAVLKEWEAKPVMTNDEAATVVKKMSKGMTIPQIKASATVKMPSFGGGGGGGNRAGGGGGFANMKFPDPKEFNPLNPESMPFEQARPAMKKNLDDFKAKLAAKAK